MKRPFFVLLALSAFMLSRCTEDDDPVMGELVFSFDAALDSNGTSGQFPDGTSILITLHKSNGESLLSFHEVGLVKFGDHFISKPLRIAPGRYTLEDLLVVKDEKVISAIPKKGSKLEPLVDNVLPYEVTIQEHTLTTAPLQVVNIENELPEDLGYSSFQVRIVNPIRITVFTHKNGKLTLTHANVTLTRGDSVFLDAKIQPGMNVLPFKGDVSKIYKLTIMKQGYENVTMDFNYLDYINKFGKIPIVIILQRESIASFNVTDDPVFYLTFYRAGSVSVLWPDGLRKTLNFRSLPGDPDNLSFYRLTHPLQDSVGKVMISGDLENIVEFAALSPLQSLDISKLINLRSLTLENSSVQSLDLTSNEEVTSLAFVNTSIEQIILPDDHRIEIIMVEGTAEVPMTFPLDVLISDVYANAVEKNIMEGAVILFNAGTISASSSEKLSHLQEAYSWYVEIE
jgi:hypothetical protein